MAAVIFIFAAAASAQRVGGYTAISTSAEDAVAAADFAVSKRGEDTNKEFELVNIAKAERQIVQGRNLRLCLEVSEGEDPYLVAVVVYMDLQNEMKLTSWKAEACAPKRDQ